MNEPLAITYREVRLAYKDKLSSEEAWRKIGDITGAGHLSAIDHATIDLTDASDSVRDRVAKVVADGEEKAEEAKAKAEEAKAEEKKTGGKK